MPAPINIDPEVRGAVVLVFGFASGFFLGRLSRGA